MSTPPSLVILAAGLGTRYGGLKQLDPVGPGGSTLMDYALSDAARAGFGRGVIVVREEIEAQVAEHLTGSVGTRFPWTLVRQRLDDLPAEHRPPAGRHKPWGTVHAVLAARREVTGPFAVANADDHYGASAYHALVDRLGSSSEWVLAGYRLARTLSPHGPVNRGICRVDDVGILEHVVEGKGLDRREDGRVAGRTDAGEPLLLTGEETVSMNLWGFGPDALPWLEEEMVRFLERRGGEAAAEILLPEAIQAAGRAGVARVRVVPVDGDTFGVTHPKDRPAVVRRLAARGPAWAE